MRNQSRFEKWRRGGFSVHFQQRKSVQKLNLAGIIWSRMWQHGKLVDMESDIVLRRWCETWVIPCWKPAHPPGIRSFTLRSSSNHDFVAVSMVDLPRNEPRRRRIDSTTSHIGNLRSRLSKATSNSTSHGGHGEFGSFVFSLYRHQGPHHYRKGQYCTFMPPRDIPYRFTSMVLR